MQEEVAIRCHKHPDTTPSTSTSDYVYDGTCHSSCRPSTELRRSRSFLERQRAYEGEVYSFVDVGQKQPHYVFASLQPFLLNTLPNARRSGVTFYSVEEERAAAAVLEDKWRDEAARGRLREWLGKTKTKRSVSTPAAGPCGSLSTPTSSSGSSSVIRRRLSHFKESLLSRFRRGDGVQFRALRNSSSDPSSGTPSA